MGDWVKFQFSLMLCILKISIHFGAAQLKGPDGFVGKDIITISGFNTKEKDTREQMPEVALKANTAALAKKAVQYLPKGSCK